MQTTLVRLNEALPRGYRIKQRTVKGLACAFFCYSAGDMDFELSLLCECNQVAQLIFDRAASLTGVDFIVREISAKPYLVTTIV